jgi:hypothetical protein
MFSSGMARVNISEISQDTRIPSFPGVYGAIAFPANKGPVGDAFSGGAVLMTSDTQFLNTFTPDGKVAVDDAGGMWSALAFFQFSNTLWSRRVASGYKYGGAIIAKEGGGNNAAFTVGKTDPEAFSFGSNDSFIIVGANPGTWNNGKTDPNGIAVRIYGFDNFPDKVKVANAFVIEVYVKTDLNNPVETWLCSKTPGTRDGFGNNIYLEDVLKASSYIRAVDNVTVTNVYPASDNGGLWTFTVTGAGAGYHVNDVLTVTGGDGNATILVNAVSVTGAVTRATLLTSGEQYLLNHAPYATTVAPAGGSGCTITVTGVGTFLDAGDNGTFPTDSDMITALDDFSNTEDKQVTVLMDGGHTTAPFASALWGLAENRRDCFAVLSTDFTAELAADYITQLLNYRKVTLNANTTFAALYTPHVQIYDKFNANTRYVPPDGYVAAAISFTGAQFELWYPPAGDTRGVINVQDVKRRFSVGEMNVLSDAQINPLRWTPGKGVRIWFDSTLGTIPNSLQAINVRMLLIVIEPAIAAALENFLFDLNTEATRARVKSLIDSYMANILSRLGVTFFRTVCDSTNNTAVDIQNFRLNVDLFITPSYPIRYINFRVILVPPNTATVTVV